MIQYDNYVFMQFSFLTMHNLMWSTHRHRSGEQHDKTYTSPPIPKTSGNYPFSVYPILQHLKQLSITADVPQGNDLSCILYNIYFKPTCIIKYRTFADNTALLSTSIANNFTASLQLQFHLNTFFQRFLTA